MDARQLAIAVIIVIVVAVLAVLLGYRWGRCASAGTHGDVHHDDTAGVRPAATRVNGGPAGPDDGSHGASSMFGRGAVRAAEEQFITVMPDMLVIADADGRIRRSAHNRRLKFLRQQFHQSPAGQRPHSGRRAKRDYRALKAPLPAPG